MSGNQLTRFGGPRLRGLPIFLFLSICLFAIACSEPEPAETAGYQRKIAYYSEKIERYPEHYPAYAMLAAAYLEKASDTKDPADVALARINIKKSIEIQPSFQAYKTFAMIEGFAHRFRESVNWANKASAAAAASVPDSETASILVIAYLGLDNVAEAEKVLASLGAKDFYASSARGHLLKAKGRTADSAAAFQDAARFARLENAGKAEAWAELMTAGVWLDTGHPDKAIEYIDKATRISPGGKQVTIHRAEYYSAKNLPEKAAALYSELLISANDPEIHRRLFLLEKARGKHRIAKQHFDAAESGFRKAIAGGEIYTLGSLARLLCDAEVRLDEAREFSEKNLRYKKDTEARKTRQCVNEKLSMVGG